MNRPLAFMDASSAILLHKADLFSACTRKFSVRMAGQAFAEVTQPGYEGADAFLAAQKARQIQVKTPGSGEPKLTGFDRLHTGEKKTLALFLQYQCTPGTAFIILDDFKAATVCRNHGLPYINALLVPKIFRLSGWMNSLAYAAATKKILSIGRYSPKIIQIAQAMTREDLAHFMVNDEQRKDP